jgi:hypothetical protein
MMDVLNVQHSHNYIGYSGLVLTLCFPGCTAEGPMYHFEPQGMSGYDWRC